ncbi:MAG: NUDIX hydrolase [Nocardioidaceae bacterium]
MPPSCPPSRDRARRPANQDRAQDSRTTSGSGSDVVQRERSGHALLDGAGGRVEFDESIRDAVAREVFEETGYLVDVGRVIADTTSPFPAQLTVDRSDPSGSSSLPPSPGVSLGRPATLFGSARNMSSSSAGRRSGRRRHGDCPKPSRHTAFNFALSLLYFGG